jgi:hypothetical protein
MHNAYDTDPMGNMPHQHGHPFGLLCRQWPSLCTRAFLYHHSVVCGSHVCVHHSFHWLTPPQGRD